MAFGTDYTPVGPMPTDIVLGDVDATSMRLARDIRDKGHGIDTRETMARMILKSSTMHNHLIKVNNSLKVQNDEYYRQFTDVLKELSEDKDYHSLPEIAGARRGYQTLIESLNNLSFNMFNINLGKITPNMVNDELLAQIAGDAAVNAVPADGSLTTPKYADKSVSSEKLADSAWESISSQTALQSLDADSSQYNVLKFDSASRALDGVSNTDISDGIYTISAGGYYFLTEKVGATNNVQAGDTISVAFKVINSSEDTLLEFETRHGTGRLFLENMRYAGNGWYIIENILLPSNTADIRIRIDNRPSSTDAKITKFVLQKGESLQPKVGDISRTSIELIEKVNVIGSKVGLKRYIPYKFPDDFRWKDNPIASHLFTDGEGNFEVVGFDIDEYMPEGKFYYVDWINGNDSNDGLSLGSAFKTVNKAKSMADSAGAYLAEGIYPRNGVLFNDTITKDFALVALPNHQVWYTSHSNSVFRVVDSMPGVYVATRGAIGTFVADLKYKVGDEPYDLEELSKASEVAEVPGSYAYAGDNLYVHLLDGREPDSDVILSANGNLLTSEGENDIFLKGINFIGGQSPLHVQNTATGLRPRVFAKDCNFKYSGSDTNDVVMIQGADLTIFENCSASGGLKDGFNYHWRNGIAPKSIEINCQGFDNGNDSDDNDQGSTTHDGGSIIRINGAYYRNSGANIAEDATSGDSPTESLNLGCVGFESTSPTESRAVNFDCYDGVKMWLDGCVGYGSPYDFAQRGNNSELKVRNAKAVIESVPDGQRLPMKY